MYELWSQLNNDNVIVWASWTTTLWCNLWISLRGNRGLLHYLDSYLSNLAFVAESILDSARMIVVVVDEVHIILGFRTVVPWMPSVSTLFTCHAGIMNVHDFFVVIGSLFKPFHQQIHLGRQHLYLLELLPVWLWVIRKHLQQRHPYSHGCCLLTHGRKSAWVPILHPMVRTFWNIVLKVFPCLRDRFIMQLLEAWNSPTQSIGLTRGKELY